VRDGVIRLRLRQQRLRPRQVERDLDRDRLGHEAAVRVLARSSSSAAQLAIVCCQPLFFGLSLVTIARGASLRHRRRPLRRHERPVDPFGWGMPATVNSSSRRVLGIAVLRAERQPLIADVLR
jgi:hypothetical protein